MKGTPPMSSEAGLSIKEQVAANPELPVCETRNRPFLIAKNDDEKRAVFFKPRCKSWSCPACAETNKNQWAMRAYQGAEHLGASSGISINFLTLTSHEKLDARASREIWPSAWQKLRQRAKRVVPGFQYLMVPEQHADGRFHVHAIETAGLGERWWKDNGRECGLGFMAEEEEARTPQGAAFYVVKYITKSIAWQEWPKGFRRVRVSRGWPVLEKMPEPEGWTFAPLPSDMALADKVRRMETRGFKVEFLDHRKAWESLGTE